MAKLMLVEDDNNLREIYEARLQAEGYTIVTAKDGEEALVVAKAEKPDLIISDVMMPKISGFEMLDILRNTEGLKEVKVIMLTALGQADDQQRGDRLGADRYLVKSQVTLEDIVKVAHELLGDAPQTAAAVSTETPAAPAVESQVVETAASTAPTTAPEPPAEAIVAAPPAEIALPTASAPPVADTQSITDQPVATSPRPDGSASSPGSIPVTDDTGLIIEEPALDATNDTATPTTSTDSTSTSVKNSDDQPAASVSSADGDLNNAQSAAEEEASIEAKIEDFIAGATTEATPPESSRSDTASASSSDPDKIDSPDTQDPTSNPIAAEDAPTVSDSNNEQISEAVDKMMSVTTEVADSTTPPAAQPAQPPDEPVAPTEPAVSVPDMDTPTYTADDVSSGSVQVVTSDKEDTAKEDLDANVKIAGKKVIKPLDNPSQPDLDTLLAAEAAKEAAQAPPPPPTAVIASNESGATEAPLRVSSAAEPPAATEFASQKADNNTKNATEEPEKPADPNSIAL